MGQGTVIAHPNRPNDPNWKILADFGTAEHDVLPMHRTWLLEAAVALRNGAWAWLRGFASRAGSEQGYDNLGLSQNRANEVKNFLCGEGRTPAVQITGCIGVGDSWSSGGPDDNDPDWRGVEVIITPRRIRREELPPVPSGPPVTKRFRWYQLNPQIPNWGLASSRSDTPAASRGDGAAALVQRGVGVANDLALNWRIDRELSGWPHASARRSLNWGRAPGGMLAVVTISVTRHEAGSVRSFESVDLVLRPYNRPAPAYEWWRRKRRGLEPGRMSALYSLERDLYWGRYE